MKRILRLIAVVLEPDPRVAGGLLLAFVVLLPVGRLYNIPFIVLSVLGLIRLVSRQTRLGSPENRFLCIAFLCIWLPMLVSLSDAVNPAESLRKTASLCIYFLAGIYAVSAFTRFRDLDWIMTGTAAVCLFWALDALWQFGTGVDWFGIPYEEGARLTGVFETGRIGYVLASFAPLVFETVRRLRRRWWWSPVLLVPWFVTIALAGSRASWGALAIAIAGYLLFLARWSGPPSPDRRRWRPGGATAFLVPVLLTGMLATYAWSDAPERMWKTVEPRIESLAGLWSGDREKLEYALTWRLSIWETAVNMWSEHWINGVGPRGFYYAYREHNPEIDYFLRHYSPDKDPTSPHMQLLEIAAETGTIGLMGYVVLAVVFIKRLYRLSHIAFSYEYPYALTLIVALFPFSGHWGFYGVLSIGVIWWTLIVCAIASAVTSRSESGS